MTSDQGALGVCTLWGAPLSFFTAKVRSYLIKKRLPYHEIHPSHPDFAARIVPAVGLFVLPVLETPDGTIVQDTSEIIDYLEARVAEPCLAPTTPVQCTVAALLGAFGSEAMIQPSMHYRWSFLDRQEGFLRAEFGFMAGMYAHLARDPVPSVLMKTRAPHVARWPERMNRRSRAPGRRARAVRLPHAAHWWHGRNGTYSCASPRTRQQQVGSPMKLAAGRFRHRRRMPHGRET